MMTSTSTDQNESILMGLHRHSERIFGIGDAVIRNVENERAPSWFIVVQPNVVTQETFLQNNQIQSEIKMLYELPQISKVRQIVAKEKEHYKNTYEGEVSLNAEPTRDYVVGKIAEVNFKDLAVEFTLLNTAIFHLKLKDDITLLITVPLVEQEDLNEMEVVYNLFIENEEVVSGSKNLNEVLAGAKELIGQRVEFTTA